MRLFDALGRTLRSVWIKFRRLDQPSAASAARLFRFRHACFKDLLASNTEFLNILTDVEHKLRGEQVFGMSYVRSQTARAVFHALKMVKSLDDLSGHKYGALFRRVSELNSAIKEELDRRKEVPIAELVLPHSRLSREMVDWVGAKNANLGELANRAGVPAPRGFAITTLAYELLLDANELRDELARLAVDLDPADFEGIDEVSRAIRGLIVSARVPPELERAVRAAAADMVGSGPGAGRVALRSSAVGEDGSLSHAGQYLSLLNVPVEDVLEAYKQVIASLYDPRATAYRLNKGMRSEDLAMSVACLEMVDAVASGVVYSRHPLRAEEDRILVTSIWGLGPYLVEGVVNPDTYVVARDPGLSILEAKVAFKPVQLVLAPDGGCREAAVARELQSEPCLTHNQVKTLAGYAVTLERHFGHLLDLEWALTRSGTLLVLQARPLPVASAQESARPQPAVPGHRVLVEGGSVAFPGVGAGPAFHVRGAEDLLRFPDGAVLVAPHSSPQFVIVMPKAQAIVTDAGSVAGHMAALAREFGVPSILGVPRACESLPEGARVTVDASSRRVYEGTVAELVASRTPRESPMKDTPIHQALRRAADLIVPLHLVDPAAADFAPEFCRTLHDVSRLVHELSYREMFKTSDMVSDSAGGWAFKLAAPIPLDLHVIDLGGALAAEPGSGRRVTPEQVTSRPLRALLRGMLHRELRARGPRPIELGGFVSVMAEQMLSPEGMAERFGARSYAIASDAYVNFSSRIGYHYSVLDAYCAEVINKNYIAFAFKGGAADDLRRHRRARAIAVVLERLGFVVEVQEDRVEGRFLKHEQDRIEAVLDVLGRLLQYTRQMDMLMTSEASVTALAERFLAEDYGVWNE